MNHLPDIAYTFAHDEQRRLSILYDAQDNVIKKIYYNGNYEVIETNGNTYEVNYLFAPEGLFGIAVKENNNPVQVYYVETDYLGSILGLYNETGQQVYAQSFDAWGRERNPTNWSYSAGGGSKPAWLIRGYTGHEHLPEQLSPYGEAGGGLINMNGRMYDPVLGRMLSPDNFVQDPSSTQSFNRYSYCWNNPLKYTDPDGNWVQLVIGAVIGGVSGYMIGQAHGATGWSMVGYIAGGAAIGALSGGAAAGVSAAGGGAIAAGAAGGAVGGAGFSGMATNWDAGAMAKGAIYGGISGGLGGGVGAAIGGGAFAGGAVGSGVNTALNGGSLKDVGISALAGGAMSFGVYHASSYLSWQFEGGNKWGDLDISYRQYTAMQADFQRSRFWGREYGGYLLDGGGVQRVGAGANSQIDLGAAPNGAFAEYHTHWDSPGQIRYVNDAGNYVDPQQVALNTPVGEQVRLSKITTARYHGSWDLNTGGMKSFVINRYDGSYYPGYGNYSVINPPINRFVYSFYFWR